MSSSSNGEDSVELVNQESYELNLAHRFDVNTIQDEPRRGSVILHFVGFGVVRIVGINPSEARIGDVAVEVAHSGFYTRAQVWLKVTDGSGDTDTETDSTIEPQLVDVLDEATEFGNTEFEELVLKEGPEQILQLMLQDQTDQFMREEISNSDDYADWIQWVSDAEERKTGSRGSMMCEGTPPVMKVQQPNEDKNLHNPVVSSECLDESTRW
ncbi:unnamed protein product [Sphagnum jensenii]|uniref:Uncharacterized protein n=1 Tax=Sphagnum jensenii TaxID=128206 RepID=A0ABP0VH50_9BRYO